MHAVQAGPAGDAWRNLGETLPRPRAVLVVSAHWEASRPTVSTVLQPQTIHDFSGFPPALYRIRYPAPGAAEVARRVHGILAQAGIEAAIDGERGLDHGAWVPLSYMYPKADVPVTQLSVQTSLGPKHHLALGRAIAAIADEGVLIVGSGHMTHNLREWMQGSSTTAAYVEEFREWVFTRLRDHDFEALAGYRSLAPHAQRAHPTEEHFLPLFVALGAAGLMARPERIFTQVERGVLAMDAYIFHPAGQA
jgi:4,5-DOPA dioxygenase extradiol